MGVALVRLANSAHSDDTAAVRRLANNQRFMTLANQPTGLIVSLYQYPADIHRNREFNRVMDLKKSHPTVPVCVILNPANGPGKADLDPNYVKAIDRLHPWGRPEPSHRHVVRRTQSPEPLKFSKSASSSRMRRER